MQADDPANTCGARAHRHEDQATHYDDMGVTGVSRQPAVGAQDRNCLCLEVVGSQMGNPGRGSPQPCLGVDSGHPLLENLLSQKWT